MMKKIVNFAAKIAVCLVLFSCSTFEEGRAVREENKAIEQAEIFVARNGYLAKGHPSNLPVLRVEIMDVFLTDDELKKKRQNTLEDKAFGVAIEPSRTPDSYYVLFRKIGGGMDDFRAVLVEHSEAVQMVHSRLSLENLSWHPVHDTHLGK